MENKNRRILLWAVLALLVIAALLAVLYYRSAVREAPGVSEEGKLLVPPVGANTPRSAEERWNYAGIIKRIDFENKFFEIKFTPQYPVLLPDFDNSIRLYFNDDLVYYHIVVETEGGAIVKVRRKEDFPFSHLGPGKPVRAFGKINDVSSAGGEAVFFADTLFVFDYQPR